MPGETISTGAQPVGTELSDINGRLAALESSNQWWPGMIAWTGGDTAPPGFLVADGSAFDMDRYAALAVIYPTGFLPNLVDRFAVGAGNLYALGTTGGAAAVTLSAAQSGLPAHTHTAGTESATHTHAAGGGAAFHLAGGAAVTWAAGAGALGATLPAQTAVESATHTHTINANSAAAASTPVSLLNPYVALTPLVHI